MHQGLRNFKTSPLTRRAVSLDWTTAGDVAGIIKILVTASSRSRNSSHDASLEPAGTRVRLSVVTWDDVSS